MTPGEASKAGKLLSIDHPDGGMRIAAHVFDLPDGGIAWADSGWSEPANPGHPYHVEPGEVFEGRSFPGWMLRSASGHDIPIEAVDGPQDGERRLAQSMITRDLGVTLAK